MDLSKYKNGPPTPELCNQLANELVEMVPVNALGEIADFLKSSPESEAIIRHVASVPSRRQRLRLLMEWQSQINVDFYPMDAENFISTTVVYKQLPSEQVVWWHKNGLWQRDMTIFSYLKDDGLLRRNIFNLVVDTDNISPEEFELVNSYQEEITNKGGIALLRQTPEIRFDAINVVIGPIRKEWSNFFIKLFSIDLIKDALKTKRFDSDNLDVYQIPPKRPPTININYIAKLV